MKITRRSISYLIVTVALLLVLVTVGGCSVIGKRTSHRFNDLLKLVPAEYASLEGPIYFTLYDHAFLYDDNGVTFSTFNEFYAAINMGLSELWPAVGGSFITGYGSYMDVTTIHKMYVGYDFTSVDAEIQFGTPPAEGVAAIGDFNPSATRDALSHQDEWILSVKNAYATEEYHGVTIHSWGDGMQMNMTTRLSPPHVDRLGRARPLAVTDDYLFYAATVPVIQMMIDASQGRADSLADLPEYAALASGLADLRAYTAIIGDEATVSGNPDYTATYGGTRLKKFLTFGSGIGKDEDGIYTAIVLYHENGSDAEENVSLLRQLIEESNSAVMERPWSEVITDIQIEAKGNLLLAKLYSSPSLWASWVYSRDTLLLHEEG